ncbi:MAG: GNAT family N-acetyltransferase [Saprospiraceae bacterium]|nr:GNAT family N-acetyltransferase [Saprospiraceae bacterium]
MIEIKKATLGDLQTISDLARKIWQDTYVHNIGQEQVDYMLALFYSPSVLSEKIKTGHEIYCIFSDKTLIGYIHLESRVNDYFIHKFYIDTSLQHKGIGSFTMAFILQKLTIEKKPLRLHVNRKNFKAINFYFKNGFTIEDYADFDIGQGYFMNDFIMLYKEN